MAGFNAPRAIPVLTSEKLKGYIYHPCFQANSSNEQSCPTIMVKYQSLCKDNYFLEQDFLMTKKKKKEITRCSRLFCTTVCSTTVVGDWCISPPPLW